MKKRDMNDKKKLAATQLQAVQREGDESLAILTDTLLENPRAFSTSIGELPPLGKTVALLAQTIGAQPPPPQLQRVIRQRVLAEMQTSPQLSWWSALRAFLRSSPQRRAWAGIAVLLLFSVAALLIDANSLPSLVGTAMAPAPGLLFLGIVLLGGGVLAIWLIIRRRHP